MDIEKEWSQRKQQFFKLWPPQNSDKINKIWNTLTGKYSEETRFYHTRKHIIKCLQQFKQIENLLTSGDAVQLSIWFHDAIYKTGAIDNEEQSAEYFSQVARGLLPKEFINRVAKLIVSTKHLSAPPNCDEAFLLDIDLSSFGSDWKTFNLDGENLRRENPQLSELEFNNNNINFFQMLLKREKIYFTDYFYAKYESEARKNINRQLQIILPSR